jgi:DNA-binding phage protein
MQHPDVQTQPWNIVDHLQSEEEILAYRHAAEEDGDPALIEAVKADIALARETHSLLQQDESS